MDLDFNTVVGWAQIIAVPIALIAIGVTIYLFFRGRQKRALACKFQSVEFPIQVKAGKGLEGEIKVLYRDKPVDNLYLVRAKLKNTGNLSIRKEHIIEPVKFIFEPETTLLRFPKVLDKKPNNLKTNWDDDTDLHSLWDKNIDIFTLEKVKPGFIFLRFDLLNPGDELTAEFLFSGKVFTPTVSARIEGVKEIEILDPNELYYRDKFKSELTEAVATLVLISVSLLAVFLTSGIQSTQDMGIALLPLILIMFFFPVLIFFRWVRYRRRFNK